MSPCTCKMQDALVHTQRPRQCLEPPVYWIAAAGASHRDTCICYKKKYIKKKKLKKLNCNFIVPFDRFPATFVALLFPYFSLKPCGLNVLLILHLLMYLSLPAVCLVHSCWISGVFSHFFFGSIWETNWSPPPLLLPPAEKNPKLLCLPQLDSRPAERGKYLKEQRV